ncbi:MAG: hypothetical protein HGB22_01765 [Chlorobiaceae bacterium]|nr:hypothetical protein [Chlorobiaceae bacterium]
MYSGKHTIGRNILRIFEIAIFFAISVLGYGLLVKTSSGNSKSKSRDQATGVQRSIEPDGLHRELKVLPGDFRFPGKRTYSSLSEEPARSFAADHFLFFSSPLHPDYRFSLLLSRQLFGFSPDSPSLPFNLLQQNPVLLV